jgi:hypothetical protein
MHFLCLPHFPALATHTATLSHTRDMHLHTSCTLCAPSACSMLTVLTLTHYCAFHTYSASLSHTPGHLPTLCPVSPWPPLATLYHIPSSLAFTLVPGLLSYALVYSPCNYTFRTQRNPVPLSSHSSNLSELSIALPHSQHCCMHTWP